MNSISSPDKMQSFCISFTDPRGQIWEFPNQMGMDETDAIRRIHNIHRFKFNNLKVVQNEMH